MGHRCQGTRKDLIEIRKCPSSTHPCRYNVSRGVGTGRRQIAWQEGQAEIARAQKAADAVVMASEARISAKVERLEEQLRGKARAETEAEV